MTFRRSQNSGWSVPRGTWHRSSSIWMQLFLLVIIAATLPNFGQVNCQLNSNWQPRSTMPNTPYKLQNLHKQRDSGPQWLDIVKARGFIGELYTALSRDNEALSIYHIINPLANQQTLNKAPVLIFHGIGSDAAQMVSHSELARPRVPVLGEIISDPSDTSLPLMLANNNFDVWMCDARGTNLNNHLVGDDLNFIQGQRYWNFSLDEQIHYDLPSIIDFVLEETHEEKLHYVGFSESTFFMFSLLSSHMDYQDKIASFTALAPVAYVEHIRGLALTTFTPAALIPDTINANYIPQIYTDTVSTTLRKLCQYSLFTRSVCPLVASAMSGKGDNELSRSFYASAIKSTSIKAVKHFLQLYAQHRYGMYDYGVSGNLRQYGTPTPPAYNLGNIKLPSIFLLRGGNDFLSTHLDQQRLLAELGVKPYLDVFYPGYNHIDFIVGRNIVQEVNLPIAKVMLDWSRELSRVDGTYSLLKDPARALLPKPVTPVAVAMPDGSREISIRSNLVNNLVNGIAEVAAEKIIPNDGGQLTGSPVLKSDFQNPLSALVSSGLMGR